LGFTALANLCLKKGIDAPLYVAYYRKKDRVYVVDKPVRLSELLVDGVSREEIAEKLCARCNELGKMDLTALPAEQESLNGEKTTEEIAEEPAEEVAVAEAI